jgi:hypothetical protein
MSAKKYPKKKDPILLTRNPVSNLYISYHTLLRICQVEAKFFLHTAKLKRLLSDKGKWQTITRNPESGMI